MPPLVLPRGDVKIRLPMKGLLLCGPLRTSKLTRIKLSTYWIVENPELVFFCITVSAYEANDVHRKRPD
jgi:hypothetical protein